MKYEKQAEGMHFFDFVFYEVEKNIMYVYCPNCGREHEIKLTNTKNVKYVKEKVKPCDCFNKVQPTYLNSVYKYANLSRLRTIAEIEKINKDKVAVKIYFHSANFDGLEYNSHRPFKRYPLYDDKLVANINLFSDGTVEISSCLKNVYSQHCGYSTCACRQFRTLKYWDAVTFNFVLIEDSLKELEGTFLEGYKNLLVEVNEYAEKSVADYYETVIGFLCCFVKYPNLVKLWKAGFKKLVFNKVSEYMYSSSVKRGYTCCNLYVDDKGIIDYTKKAKTLPQILKIEPSKLDMFCEREDLKVETLKAAQELCKLGQATTLKNMEIYTTFQFKHILLFFKKYASDIKLSKIMKFIRNQSVKSDKRSAIEVVIYNDYLEMLAELKTPITSEVLFPTNLNKAHDYLADKIEISKCSEINRKYRNAIRGLTFLEFADNNFNIKLVRSAAELVTYSKVLENCSARYVNKVINRDSIIMVVTKKHSEEIYMIEYDDKHNEVRQNLGVNNSEPSNEEIQFVEKWLKNISNKVA